MEKDINSYTNNGRKFILVVEVYAPLTIIGYFIVTLPCTFVMYLIGAFYGPFARKYGFSLGRNLGVWGTTLGQICMNLLYLISCIGVFPLLFLGSVINGNKGVSKGRLERIKAKNKL